MRSSSAPPRTSRAGRPAPRRGAGRGRRGAHHAFLCLIPQSSRIFSYVAALARLPRPALPVFESFLVKCLKFNLKVTLYHVSNILTHRSGLRSSTHPFRVRGSFKFFPGMGLDQGSLCVGGPLVLRPRGGATRCGSFFLSRKILFWRFGRFRNTRNLDKFYLGFRISRGKVRSVIFFSGKIARFICVPSFFLRNTRF